MTENRAAMSIAPPRTVHCADALQWLREHPLVAGHALLTSLPDSTELRTLPLPRWRDWFVATAEQVAAAAPPRSAAIFFQTDVHRDGRWVDKAFLVQQGALAAGVQLLWHKIVCRAPAGTVTRGRPGYAHLLCFSRELGSDPAFASADVLPDLGPMAWPRGMGLCAAEVAVRWLRDAAGAHTLVAPFCGRGTALAVANALGLGAVGIERSPARAEQARTLRVRLDAQPPAFVRAPHPPSAASRPTPGGDGSEQPLP